MSVLATTPVPHAPAGIRRPSRSGFWLLSGLIALVGVGKAVQADTMDPDAFWHLRVADQLLRDGVGPLVDSISFASLRTPWTPYSWLAELMMHGIWQVGGFRLATLVTAACSAAIVLSTAGAMRARVRQSNDLGVALLTAAAAYFTLPFISFRPVTFALVLLAVIAWLLVRDRDRSSRVTWAVVPLTLVLTNLHLYSVVAVALVVATAAGAWFDDRSAFRRSVWMAVATAAAAGATPMLPGMVATALRYNAQDPMVASQFITEMRPFYSGGSGKLTLVLFAVGVGLCVAKRHALNATDWLWLILGTVLLFRLGRFSPVFAILASPAVARAFPTLSGEAIGKPVIRAALCAVLLVGGVNLLPSMREHDFDHWLNRNNANYPTAAAAFVEQSVTPRYGRLVNEFNWGGYLSWRLGANYQVLMDGRTQMYTPAFWRQTHLGTPQTRLELLAGVRADAAVLPAKDSCLAGPLVELGWREAYRDELAVVWVPGKGSGSDSGQGR